MALYNMKRFTHGLLKIHETSPPSFTVRLYREYWTLNNGSKFLYNHPTASLLDDIRTQHIPVDLLGLFDAAELPFYQGCLIVELFDYRPARSSEPELEIPDKTRVVLTPNDESLWADICLVGQKYSTSWTDADALEMEARLLMATAPPLCLEPDVHLTRIVNATQRVSTPPAPNPLKRKAAAVDQEADEIEKDRRLKLMQYMSPQRNVPPGKFPILDAIQRMKQAKANAQAASGVPGQPNAPTTASPHPAAVPNIPPVIAPSSIPAIVSALVPAAQAAPPASSTPVPSTVQYQHSPNANASSPAPITAGSPSLTVQNIKKPSAPAKKKPGDAGQSPHITRASVTPAPTAPSGVPLPIPPHLQQHYQAQLAQRTATPVPPQSPHSVSHASSPPAPPEQRPPSAVPTPQAAPAQSVQQAHATQQRLAQPSPAPTPQQQSQQPTIAGYNTQMAATLIAQQQHMAARRKAAAAGQPNVQAVSQNYYQYVYQVQAQAQAQARLTQTQQQQAAPTPGASQSPMPNLQAQAAAAAQRKSPMVSSQQLAARSPMPPARPLQSTPQPQQQQQPSQGQMHAPSAQHHHLQQQQQQQPQMNPYVQYQHPMRMQQRQAAAAAALQNPQMLAQYQMYGYPGMSQLPQGYWQVGAGRGMAVTGGQPMAGMSGHPQQQQPGTSVPKSAQGGQQGS